MICSRRRQCDLHSWGLGVKGQGSKWKTHKTNFGDKSCEWWVLQNYAIFIKFILQCNHETRENWISQTGFILQKLRSNHVRDTRFDVDLGDGNIMGKSTCPDFNTIGTWVHNMIGVIIMRTRERMNLEDFFRTHIMGKLRFRRWAVYWSHKRKNDEPKSTSQPTWLLIMRTSFFCWVRYYCNPHDWQGFF